VAIGRDKIMGLEDKSYLTPERVTSLKQKNITVLSQAWNNVGHIGRSHSWYSYTDLSLSCLLAVEWDPYIKDLISSNFSIMDGNKILMWTGGYHSIYLTTKKCTFGKSLHSG